MELKVRDKESGRVYSSDMSSDTCIIEIHFCTSYTQVIVQDSITSEEGTMCATHDIIIPPLGTDANLIDLIATHNDPEGEWVH